MLCIVSGYTRFAIIGETKTGSYLTLNISTSRCDAFELVKGTNEEDKTRIVVHTEILVAIRKGGTRKSLTLRALSRGEDSDGWWRREDTTRSEPDDPANGIQSREYRHS